MKNDNAKCQEIVIKHQCGGSFTIIPNAFIAGYKKNEDPRYRPVCLNCYEPVNGGLMQRLKDFCSEYHQTVKSLADRGFTITIIQPEDQRVRRKNCI
jgi:hypothetical protein